MIVRIFEHVQWEWALNDKLTQVAWSMAVDLVPEPLDQAKLFPLLVPLMNGTVASDKGGAAIPAL
jgi:hypothetical protein